MAKSAAGQKYVNNFQEKIRDKIKEIVNLPVDSR